MADQTVMSEVVPAADSTTAVPSWRDALPDDVRADKSLESFKDVGGLAKSYIETKKLVGQKSAVPGKDAKPEEIAAYRAAIGVPATPGEYKITRPDVALDGPWDTAAETQFLTKMHELGASPAIVQAAIDIYGQMERATLEANTKDASRIGMELRQEWGPNYEAHLGRANRALQEFGGDALIEALAASGFGRHPLMVKAWAKVGDALVEHGAMRGDGFEGVSASEAQAKATALRAELKTLPEGHARTAALVDEIATLTRVARTGR